MKRNFWIFFSKKPGCIARFGQLSELPSMKLSMFSLMIYYCNPGLKMPDFFICTKFCIIVSSEPFLELK